MRLTKQNPAIVKDGSSQKVGLKLSSFKQQFKKAFFERKQVCRT